MNFSKIFNRNKVVSTENHNKMAENEENLSNENVDITEESENINKSVEENPTIQEDIVESISEEEKLKNEVAQLNEKFVRLYAEFDNFKRRTQKERTELLQTAGKEMIVAMLPVLDDFERAEKALDNSTEISAVKEGLDLVHQKLKNILSQKGLKEMNAIGETFDADIHEAITNIPAPSETDKGKVVDQMEKGYLLNDKVIRYAKVIVGA